MKNIKKIIKDMKESPRNVRFSDLEKVCIYYFGEPRNKGTSHHVYKMPWMGDPRVNIQRSKGDMSKPYQVKQVLKAILKIEEAKND